jgi:hypothetical protein
VSLEPLRVEAPKRPALPADAAGQALAVVVDGECEAEEELDDGEAEAFVAAAQESHVEKQDGLA